VRSQGKVL